MNLIYLCSAISKGKVVDLRFCDSLHKVAVYSAECNLKGYTVEYMPWMNLTPAKKEHKVAYIPPPRWAGRVVCVETGWIFTSISAAAKHMNGSQWALRKAVLRNTVYHHYHWRMYCDVQKKIDKFT